MIIGHSLTLTNQLQIVFKENSGLPLDVESTQVAFKSMFINEQNQYLFPLVKRTRIEYENMSTAANLAILQTTHTS